MATELHEEVVLITNPQLVTTSANEVVSVGPVPSRGPFSGSVELGRRLLLAARHGHTAQVLELMAKGAPFTTDWLGTSPLHVAAYGAHVETCAVLLRAGVSRDSRTKVERTPLHLAAHAGHAAVAALLLERGALVDCKDMLRMTPLHWAAERGHVGVARVLLRHGADPRALSKFHKTPLSLAAARGHAALLRLLEDAAGERDAAAARDNEQMAEIPAAEQQQALESIERLQESVKPASKVARATHVKLETEPEPQPEEPAAEPGGARAAEGAAALLRRHGITLLPPDSSSTVLNAIQSGRTVVLSDAGKLMLKESSSAAPSSAKGVILTAAPVRAPPAGVKIFTLNNKLRPADKLAAAPQDMQIKLVSLPDTKLSSPTKLSSVSMKAKARRPGAGALRHPVKIIMQKANFDKMLGKGNAAENGAESEPVQITSTTDLGKVLQVSNATATIAPSNTTNAVDISNTGGVNITLGNTGGANNTLGNTVGANNTLGNTGGVNNTLGNTGGVNNTLSISGGANNTGSDYMCVPAEFFSSNSPAYLRSQLLSAHKTIHDLTQQVSALKEQLEAYESL